MDMIRCDIDSRGIATLTLNRPEKHNALNAQLIAEFTQQLADIHNNNDVRVVVITAEGRSFCSGADLEWMKASVAFDEATNRADAQRLADLLRALYAMNKPTIAKINGSAYGGGVGLIACCDIAVADDSAQFAFTEVRLGLIPAVISPYIIQALGKRLANKLFMTAERFSAQQALAMGLLHHVTTQDKLADELEALCENLLKAGPQALNSSKTLLRAYDTPTSTDLAQLIASVRASDEGQAGLAAFLNKTPPPWCK